MKDPYSMFLERSVLSIFHLEQFFRCEVLFVAQLQAAAFDFEGFDEAGRVGHAKTCNLFMEYRGLTMTRPAWMELPKPSKPYHWAWIFTMVSVVLAWLARPDPQHVIFHNASKEDLLLQHTPANWKDLELVTPAVKKLCEDRRLRDRAFYYCSDGWIASAEVVNSSGSILCKEEFVAEVKTTRRFKHVNITFMRNGYSHKSSYSNVASCEIQFALAVLNGEW